MAVPAYSRWLAAGKPLDPAQPIADIVGRLKAAYPRAAHTFGWGADDAHYQAVPAQDHTPYSQTGWPVASPEWWVFATDVMHRPDLGVDCGVLFGYWLSEARAGRMPWLKYMIWQAQLYDVRNGWRAQASSGHYDHIHLSVRTDYRTTGLGAWSITPTGDDMADVADIRAWGLETVLTARRIEVALTAIASKVDISPDELAAIKRASTDGMLAVVPALVDALVARLPANAMTREDVEQAVRDAFAGGLAPDVTPTAGP